MRIVISYIRDSNYSYDKTEIQPLALDKRAISEVMAVVISVPVNNFTKRRKGDKLNVQFYFQRSFVLSYEVIL